MIRPSDRALRGVLVPRRDLAVGAAACALLAQLLFAQLTIAIAGCLVIAGWLSRWRPVWLALPAISGMAWVLAVGIRPTAAGYLACAGHVLSHLARPGLRVAGLARLRGLLAGWQRWLPAQLPGAVPVAAAEAAVIGLLGRRGARGSASADPLRGHRYRAGGRMSSEPLDLDNRYRPGGIVIARRSYLAWSTGRGELATANGGCVGISWSTGRRAEISWLEAQGGVLCTGQDAAGVTATGLALTLAAIAHRKAVLVIDLAGDARDLGRAGPVEVIEAACANAGAPLRRFGGPRGCYDPLAGSEAHGVSQHGVSQHGVSQHGAADLVLAMIDWTGVGHARQRFCADYINAAMTVIAATATGRARPPAAVLDELTRLLQPGTLRARAWELAHQSTALRGLADQVAELAGQLDAEPAAVAPVAGQLQALRACALGRWLRRATGDPGISLRRALADREVALFSLDRTGGGWPATMIARLVLADLTAILTERGEVGAPADCVVWVNGCEAATPRQLTSLVGRGASGGAAVLLGTAADPAAARLAAQVNVVAIRGQAPPSLGRPGQAPPSLGRPGQAPPSLGRPGQAPPSLGWLEPARGRPGRSGHPHPARADTVAAGGMPAWPTRAGSDLDPPEDAPASPAGVQARASLETKDDSPLPAHLLTGRHRDALSLLVRGPRPRLLTGCRAVR